MGSESEQEYPLVAAMTSILLGLFTLLFFLGKTLRPTATGACWLPCPVTSPGKYWAEVFFLRYSVIWIGSFAAIILLQLYEVFTEHTYMLVCGGLAAPLLLQPLLYPGAVERALPLSARYSAKATVWIAIYSFVGNYWCTHYFYSVLRAKYTLPSWRLNDVPIPLYFATHFYFITYHTFSNLLLRRIHTGFEATAWRSVFIWVAIFVMAYSTAFMETLTISGFPYYSFEDRTMAFTVGSAFYAIYFMVSFPMFHRIDEPSQRTKEGSDFTMLQTAMESLGSCMLIILLLDLTRLALGVPLHIAGEMLRCGDCRT